MSLPVYAPLQTLARPLLDKFYRQHRSAMRLPTEAQGWVAREGEIIAGLCLTPVSQGQWLTGLLVTPGWRGRGVAQGLIEASIAPGPVWLFCNPQLRGFYERLEFDATQTLPPALAERLKRYRQSKELIAMQRGQVGD